MPANTNHLYAIRESGGEHVFIEVVPNGNKCGCISSKCKEPLVAKNRGKINAHHFAHRSESNSRGKSLAHIEEKEFRIFSEFTDEDDQFAPLILNKMQAGGIPETILTKIRRRYTPKVQKAKLYYPSISQLINNE